MCTSLTLRGEMCTRKAKEGSTTCWQHVQRSLTKKVAKAPKKVSKVPKAPLSVETICVKVASLRKKGYADLREWLADPSNVYVGRRGRIFIQGEIFHYPGSKFANPFTLKEHSLEKSLDLYRTHLKKAKLDPSELRGKVLGCFCAQERDEDGSPRCHALVLADMVNV